MAGIQSELSVTGQQKLERYLEKLQRDGNNPSEILNEIGSMLVDSAHDRINRGFGTDDRAWQKSWRARMQGGITLRNTGRLYNAINYRLTQGGKSVAVGVDGSVKYARILQFGGIIVNRFSPYLKFKTPLGGWAQVKSVKIPPRPYLGISVDDAQEIINIIEDHLESVLKDAK